MKIEDLSTAKLRRVLNATERCVGPDAVEVLLLRQELTRRKVERKHAVKQKVMKIGSPRRSSELPLGPADEPSGGAF